MVMTATLSGCVLRGCSHELALCNSLVRNSLTKLACEKCRLTFTIHSLSGSMSRDLATMPQSYSFVRGGMHGRTLHLSSEDLTQCSWLHESRNSTRIFEPTRFSSMEVE